MTTNGRPSKVAYPSAYWGTPPPEPSPRLTWWVQQIENGWLPNRRINTFGYHIAAEWYGVYIWEYLNILSPLIRQKQEATTP